MMNGTEACKDMTLTLQDLSGLHGEVVPSTRTYTDETNGRLGHVTKSLSQTMFPRFVFAPNLLRSRVKSQLFTRRLLRTACYPSTVSGSADEANSNDCRVSVHRP